jgi:hypothetical protein
MVPDIDWATRDPRTLEDLIDAVELYGLYVASLTGNINHGRRYFCRTGPGESAEPGIAEHLPCGITSPVSLPPAGSSGTA